MANETGSVVLDVHAFQALPAGYLGKTNLVRAYKFPWFVAHLSTDMIPTYGIDLSAELRTAQSPNHTESR